MAVLEEHRLKRGDKDGVIQAASCVLLVMDDWSPRQFGLPFFRTKLDVVKILSQVIVAREAFAALDD